MPIVQIQVLQGRPESQMKELITNVTDAVVKTLEAPRESVRVIITEEPKTHWGIGGITVSDMPGR